MMMMTILKMEAADSSEIWVHLYLTPQRRIKKKKSIDLHMCTENDTTEDGFTWQTFVITQYWTKVHKIKT